jgi:putative membrane protein
MKSLNAKDKESFLAATKLLESHSSAEIVISVRGKSGSYLHVPFIVGILTALASLSYMLFSEDVFPIHSFAYGPVIVGLGFGLISSESWLLARWLTRQSQKRRWVEQAAKACFFDKKIYKTTGRSGLLLYISLLERMSTIVCDLGVEKGLSPAILEEHGQVIDDLVRKGRPGTEVAHELEKLAPYLAKALPADEDDINELPDGAL